MSMATQKRKPRLMLSISEASESLLRGLQAQTGLSPAQTIQKVFPAAHREELYRYLQWLEQLPEDSPKLRIGKFFIHDYNGTPLLDRIKEIDPTYVPK